MTANSQINTVSLEYKIGDKINNMTIESIISQNTFDSGSYIIFESDEEVYFRWWGDTTNEINQIIDRYKDIKYKVRSVSKYNHQKISYLLAHTLDTAIRCTSNCDLDDLFKQISIEIENDMQQDIISSTKHYHIFINKDNDLIALYDNNIFHVNEKNLIKFHYLKNKIISSEFSEKKYKIELNLLLGTALSHVLNNNSDQTNHYFEEVEKMLNIRREEAIKHNYLFATISMMLVVLVTAWSVIPSQFLFEYNIFTSALAGSLGAMLSTLQRRNKLEFNQDISLMYVRLEGVVRVFLGVIFGCLAFALSQADIAFGFLNDYSESGKVYALFIYSMIAGLSERLIPEILDNVEKNHIN
jgi:hypothetical protein